MPICHACKQSIIFRSQNNNSNLDEKDNIKQEDFTDELTIEQSKLKNTGQTNDSIISFSHNKFVPNSSGLSKDTSETNDHTKSPQQKAFEI